MRKNRVAILVVVFLLNTLAIPKPACAFWGGFLLTLATQAMEKATEKAGESAIDWFIKLFNENKKTKDEVKLKEKEVSEKIRNLELQNKSLKENDIEELKTSLKNILKLLDKNKKRKQIIIEAKVTHFQTYTRLASNNINDFRSSGSQSPNINNVGTLNIYTSPPKTELNRTNSKPIKTKKVKSLDTFEIDNFVFKLKRCKASGKVVTVTILMINKANSDRSIKMSNGGNARIIDSFGEEYRHRKLLIGKAGGYALYQGVRLVSNIPVKSVVTFDGVPKSVDKIALFEIITWSGFNIQFKNISISR